MISKKFSLMLAAAMLSLAACGEDPPASEEETPAEESPETEETMPADDAMEQEPEAEEDTTEDSDASPDSAPEAMSGSASDLLSNGDSTSFVFTEAGEYAIFCELHPAMQMTVIVEEGAEAMDTVSVDITDYEFGEETLTVAPGTTIEWTNQGQVQHNVAFE